ncbi:MAG: hypothetical protein NTW30_05755 [Candidatus Aenigmarchaeota archaeon]|nr:hypothetical protein [Candidatus Aenigmarchaeota archaeon]
MNEEEKEMAIEIKSGEELLNEFFEELKVIPDVDKDVIDILYGLYHQDKLSRKNITNALSKSRGETAK